MIEVIRDNRLYGVMFSWKRRKHNEQANVFRRKTQSTERERMVEELNNNVSRYSNWDRKFFLKTGIVPQRSRVYSRVVENGR